MGRRCQKLVTPVDRIVGKPCPRIFSMLTGILVALGFIAVLLLLRH